MSDGLPRLLPTDPKNLLSVEARKRIHRAIIEADNYVWEAEVAIEKRGMDRFGPKAYSLRNEANFKKAKAALSVYRREFSRIDIPERKFREIMKDEIESASHSLELSDVQRRLLENAFFFPEERPLQPRLASTPPASENPETLAAQINRLREECRLTAEELAEKIDIDIRSVQRHLAGKTVPYARYLRKYEREFSKLLSRQIVIRKMS